MTVNLTPKESIKLYSIESLVDVLMLVNRSDRSYQVSSYFDENYQKVLEAKLTALSKVEAFHQPLFSMEGSTMYVTVAGIQTLLVGYPPLLYYNAVRLIFGTPSEASIVRTTGSDHVEIHTR